MDISILDKRCVDKTVTCKNGNNQNGDKFAMSMVVKMVKIEVFFKHRYDTLCYSYCCYRYGVNVLDVTVLTIIPDKS